MIGNATSGLNDLQCAGAVCNTPPAEMKKKLCFFCGI